MITPKEEYNFIQKLREQDEKELLEILEIIQEAKEEGDTCEVFFLDEYPEIEGWCICLKEMGYKCEYRGRDFTRSWVVSW